MKPELTIRPQEWPIGVLTDLGEFPFIGARQLACVTGRPRAQVCDTLNGLLEAGLVGRVKHSTPFLPETFRYYLTLQGIAEASAAQNMSLSAYLRTYPVSKESLRILIERADAMASIHALAAILSQGAGRTQVQFFRQGSLDAVITLHDGKTIGVMRRGRALRPKSWRDRVMRFWLREQSTDGLLILVPSPWEISMVVRWGGGYVLPYGHVAAESADALTNPNSKVWHGTSSVTGGVYTLSEVVAETKLSGRTPAASPSRTRASLPDPTHMVQEAPTFGMTPDEKLTFYIVTAHPMILRRHLLAWLDVSDGWLTQIMRRLQDKWGLAERHGRRRGYRYALSLAGIRYITRRDRAELRTSRKAWSTAPPDDPESAAQYHGRLINTWARRTAHTDGQTWWLSRLASEARDSSDSELLWWVPEAWTTRPFHWNEHTVAPDAVGELVTDGIRLHFFLEYEKRAKSPSGIRPRLWPYQEYYTSFDTSGDLPSLPLCLFVVDTESVAETYVETARADPLLQLPILVAPMPKLATTGILGPSWRPLWEPDSPTVRLSAATAYSWNRLNQRMGRRD